MQTMDVTRRLAVLPLSGCPVTNGHLHLIERCLPRCGTLIVLVANNDEKSNYLFEIEERMAMMRRATAHLPKVRVMSSEGLLVDFFLEQGCDVVFRGNRCGADMVYEHALIDQHASIYPPIRNCFEFPKTDDAFAQISATLVRTRAKHFLDVDHLAPLFVQQALQEKIHGQFKLGVTGGIASGKTFVAKALVERVRSMGVSAHLINVDGLIRQLYDEQTGGAQKVRETLATLFGDQVLIDERRRVDRTKIKEVLFDPSAPVGLREKLEKLTAPQVDRLYRAALKGKRGLVVLEWAQLAEMGMHHWTNNNVLVVEAASRIVNARERGISVDTLEEMSKFQWRADQKAAFLREQCVQDKHGTVLEMANPRNPLLFKQELDNVVAGVRELFPGLKL